MCQIQEQAKYAKSLPLWSLHFIGETDNKKDMCKIYKILMICAKKKMRI